MGIFKGLTRAIVGVAALPIDAIADVVTLGGTNTGQDRTYTGKRASDILDALNEATEREK